jgi:hypothetical protein
MVTTTNSQRGNYWIEYRLSNGKQRKEYVGYKRKDAEDADAKRRVQKREGNIFDVKPDAKMTFRALTDWYLALERVKSLACYRRRTITLKCFNEVFGDVIVSRIRPVDLENYQAKKKAEGRADARLTST